MPKQNIEVIEFEWNGPYKLDNVLNLDKGNGKGLYQIYGTHPVFGKDQLLYLGMTDNFFAARFGQHKNWLELEYDDPKIYLGKLVSGHKDDAEIACDVTTKAERLLLYYTCPPYNSSGLGFPDEFKGLDHEYLIVNHGKISMLPPCVTTLNYTSEYFKRWKKDEGGGSTS